METVQKVTHTEHILLRPDSYVGSVEKVSEPLWILKDEQFVNTQLTYPPALLKIFDEILVNAIDRNSTYPNEVTNISVEVDPETGVVSIENNGPLGGIRVEQHPTEKTWNPELTFGHLLTSTNYNDNTQRTVGGRNGYGAKLANVYSKLFVVTIKDDVNKVKYIQKWENNMKKCYPPKITKYSGAKSSVNILFLPDYERFGMNGLEDDFLKVIEKRVWDAAVCTSSQCAVYYQKKRIKQITLEKYAKMYLESGTKTVSISSDWWQVVVAPSDTGFQQLSFVNGICTTKGGTHVDYVTNHITAGITSELKTKIKLRPQQIKNSMFVFVKATLVNPSFSSQVKSECTLKSTSFQNTIVITQQFIKQLLKTGIQEELLAQSKLTEQKELKKTDGARKSKINGIPKLDDANWAGTAKSAQCTLIITEGDSAKTLAVAGLSVVGRDRFGVFPMRGKCKNVREASVKQLMGNQEFSDLKKILGLKQDQEYSSLSELRYGRLMIMTDADNDGSHIKGLILNMIQYFWPSLLDLGFVVSMVTPIIKATKARQIHSFYTDSAFREWWGTGQSGWNIKYYKGLGTSTSKEAQEYFKTLDKLTVGFQVDESAENALILAFDKKRADHRKQWLLESTAKSKNELEVAYGNIQQLSISDFIHKDFVNFSLADLHRSIAHMADGLKPSQRKVLYTCLRKNITKEIKVAQLAAMTAEFTSYHHGETSMADTIVNMAQDYMGSNNINLLVPSGQFGTRLQGGKDASQTRYIFTHLSQQTRNLFNTHDDPILNYLDDDGKSIEPEYYVPELPTVLINGTEGIGTGFSTYVPPYNPDDIKENILRALGAQRLKPMAPWFRGFKGQILKNEDGVWVAHGIIHDMGSNCYHVTELPPGRWTQEYKEYLDTLVEKGTIDSYKNNSTTETVDFEIKGYNGKDVTKDFKMTKAIHVTNMHLFHPVKGIQKYTSPEEILIDFIEIRLKTYSKRKQHLINILSKECAILKNKARFIQMVVDDNLVVFRRKRTDIEQDLKKLEFKKFDDSYDYLMNIKTYQYTEEAILKMTEEVNKLKSQLKEVTSTSTIDMWKKDIIKC